MNRWEAATRRAANEALGIDRELAEKIHNTVLRNLSARNKAQGGSEAKAPPDAAKAPPAASNAAKANAAKTKDPEEKARAFDNAERVKGAAALHDWQSNENTTHGPGGSAGKGAAASKSTAASKGAVSKSAGGKVEVIDSEIEVSSPDSPAPAIVDRVVEASAPKNDPAIVASAPEAPAEPLAARLMAAARSVQGVAGGAAQLMNPLALPISALMSLPDAAFAAWGSSSDPNEAPKNKE